MRSLNRVLQDQLALHFGSLDQIPAELAPFLRTASLTYDERLQKSSKRTYEPELIMEYASGAFISHGVEKGQGKRTIGADSDLLTEQREDTTDDVKAAYNLISEVTRAIIQTDNEQELLRKAFRAFMGMGGTEMAWLVIKDQKGCKSMAESWGMPPALADLAAEYLNSNLSAGEEGERLTAMEDIATWMPAGALKEYFIESKIQAGVYIPLLQGANEIGSIYLFVTDRAFFEGERLDVLRDVSDELSYALGVLGKEALREGIEQKLRHSESGLRQAQAIAHFGSWEMDYSTGLAFWSDEACRIYGLDTEDNKHSYESWAAMIHPEDRASFMKVLTGGVESLTSNAAFYHRIYRKDGKLRFAYSQTKYELDNDGVPVRLYGVTHDVTEMKDAQNALIQSEANLRLLIDLIPQAIYARDQNGKFVFVNENYASLFGMEARELLDKTLDQIMPPGNDLDVLLEQDQQVLNSGETLEIPETTFTDYRGITRKYYSVKVPFSTTQNEQAVLGISLNITEQLLADAERKKIIADIMQRNNSLEQFSYIISHNLRAPVANIVGIKDVLRNSENTEEERKYLTDGLFTAVEKLDMVIMDINHILQIRHQVNERKELVRFSQIIEDIKVSISNLLVDGGAEIIYDFGMVDEITAVKSYVYSIFFNLISNSIKYRRTDLKPVIHITSKRSKGGIEIIFTDNGMGMDVIKHKDKLFGLYKRFHNHTEGRGMGLYMVKTQVETIGGRISLTSKVNEGTKFKIVFDTTAQDEASESAGQ